MRGAIPNACFRLIVAVALLTAVGVAQQPPPDSRFAPPGVAQAYAGLTSQPGNHISFTFDRDMLDGILGSGAFGLTSVTVQTTHFQEQAFYVPEALAALTASYYAAGWKHLMQANLSPREQAAPTRPVTDLWMHFRGTEIDDIAVLIRAPREMSVVEASGMLRPLDLVHLGGHFGIPRVDPDAVMVPAPPGH